MLTNKTECVNKFRAKKKNHASEHKRGGGVPTHSLNFSNNFSWTIG